ncbi:hypothetical protein Q9R32_14755 [Actinotalea sp. AC32]|nr:hypothetical protein [Actinotalea sp. AC32]
MSKHICVYFDDGGLEPTCVCGDAVVLLVDEDGVEVLAVLDRDERTATVSELGRPAERERLAVPA